ncbi:hypothetical protein [Halobellus captivus]|uniref:hypothetical protein n=1 Tax=Halobellus captivus TaxID=2592614 RepID=UPI00193A8D92|nr:hypothetical protein [Halobellus captivus]
MDGTAAISRLLELAGVGPRESTNDAERSVQYRCQGCDSAYDVQYHVCPECGGFSVELQVQDDCPSASETTDRDDSTTE